MHSLKSRTENTPPAEVICEPSGLGAHLADQRYVRSRLQPGPADVDCLILTDLADWIRRFGERVQGPLFDYGCGGAPYRALFPHCQPYIGADIEPGPRVDRVLTAEGLTREKSGEYQVVLSSQVLEHVKDTAAYLRECHRLLRPGGRLLLSTHGMFHEHGCPNDFYRWTNRGLEELIKTHGFEIVESVKLTVEFRGVIQLLHYFVEQLSRPKNVVGRMGWGVIRRVYRKVGVPVLNRIGRGCGGSGVVPATHPARIYVGIGVEARKRSD